MQKTRLVLSAGTQFLGKVAHLKVLDLRCAKCAYQGICTSVLGEISLPGTMWHHNTNKYKQAHQMIYLADLFGVVTRDNIGHIFIKML